MPDFSAKPCDQCGYDLTGLPRQGNCPECGQCYDLATGRGVSAPSRLGRSLHADRLRTLGCAALALLVLVCGGALALLAKHPLEVIGFVGLVAILFALAALTSYFYESAG